MTANATRLTPLSDKFAIHRVDTIAAPRGDDGSCNFGQLPYDFKQHGWTAIVRERDATSCGAVVSYVTLPNPGAPASTDLFKVDRDKEPKAQGPQDGSQ
jgi:hypothetical protein